MDGCRRADGEFSRRIHDAVERASLDVQSGSSSDEEEEDELEEEQDKDEDSSTNTSSISSLCPLPVQPPNSEPKTIPTVSNPNSVYRVSSAGSGWKNLWRANFQFGVSDACTVKPLVVILVFLHFYSSVSFHLVHHRPGWGISGRPSLGKCSHHLMPLQQEVQALSLPARKASSPTGPHSPSLGLGLTSTTGSANPVPSTRHSVNWISTLGWEAGSEKRQDSVGYCLKENISCCHLKYCW